MDRVAIKEEAKAKIKGNIWNLLWPLLIIVIFEGVMSNIFGNNTQNALANIDFSNADMNTIFEAARVSYSPMEYLISVLFSIVNVAYLKYVLNFVRKGKMEFNDIIDCIKTKWLNILAVSILTSLAITFGLLLFIIPGIIIGLGLSMASLIVIDSDLGPIDAIKKSWKIMTGYKGNYFIFLLSFLGWILLSPFTFGLLFIWLIPYMTVAEVLYYDKLIAKNK